MAVRSRQQESPRILIMPAPIMIRKHSQRNAQIATQDIAAPGGKALKSVSGTIRMEMKPVSRSCDSQPKPYHR